MEIWKDIEGYEGLYQVSNLGRVKSLKYDKEKIMKLWTNPRGYLNVYLCKNNKKKCGRIHRLVAEAFIPNPDNLPCVDHINCIITDNRVENLRWCTQWSNIMENPLSKEKVRKACSETGKRTGKLNARAIIAINFNTKEELYFNSAKEASETLNINYINISQCLHGKRAHIGGYIIKRP